MNYEKNMIEDMRREVESNPKFIEQSKDTLLLFPYTLYLYRPDVILFRTSMYIMYEKLIYFVFEAGEGKIRSELESIKKITVELNLTIVIIGYSIFIFTYMISMWFNLLYDFEIASETIKNIVPEILIQNKLVFKTFNKAFPVYV